MSERGTEWSARDRQRIAAEGLTVAEADRQLALFRGGVSPVRLNRPCRVGDGIARLTTAEQEELLAAYEGAFRGREITKFVPASGAASRMFKEWFSGLREGGFAAAADADDFLRNLGIAAAGADVVSRCMSGRECDRLAQDKNHCERNSLEADHMNPFTGCPHPIY